MITDPSVFDEDFVPSDIEYRHTEIDHLATALDPITRGDTAANVCCFGPTGAGKTCTARWTVDHLQSSAAFDAVYLSCWDCTDRRTIVRQILDDLDPCASARRESMSRSDLVDELRASVDRPCVVTLDEVDQLGDDALRVLYDLYETPRVSMILIANAEQQFFAALSSRVHSRLVASASVTFDPYSINELVGILSARVRAGLAPGVVDEDVLKTIADAAAGNARAAIGMLHLAALVARRHAVDRIDEAILDEAIPEARSRMRAADLARLNDTQRALVAIVDDHGPLATRRVHDRFAERSDADSISLRTVQRNLAKLANYELVRDVSDDCAGKWVAV